MSDSDAKRSTTVESTRAARSSQEESTTGPLSPALLERMNRYWQAANYLSVGQIYLYDNPLLKKSLKLT
jgi:phosphoketolase